MILDAKSDFIAKMSPLVRKYLAPNLRLGKPSVLNPMAVMIHKVTNALVSSTMLSTAIKAKETIFFCHFVVISSAAATAFH